MALQWDVRELLRATGEGLPAVTELVPFNASTEAMLRDSGANCFAKLAPKRKARGGIPMEAFTDRLIEADRERASAQAAKVLGPACKDVDTVLNRGLSAVAREMTKARRRRARRDAVNESLSREQEAA